MLTFGNLSQAMYLFHDRISPTVERNYSLMKKVFTNAPDTLEVIEFIHKNSEKINESSILLFLNNTSRVDSAKDRYIQEYRSIIETPDTQIDQVISDLKSACYRTMINELSQVSDTPDEYVKRVLDMDWSIGIEDLEHQNVEICEMDKLNPDEVKESLGTPIVSRFSFINKSSPIGGYIKNTINLIGGAPAAGKSQFAMDEFLFQVEQGYHPVYIALGDLLKIDFMSRLIAKYYNFSIDYAFMNIDKYWSKMMKELHDKNGGTATLIFVRPETVTASELVTMMDRKGIIKDHDIIWVDYDNNFHSDSDSLFGKGGEIYQQWSYVSRMPNKTIFILSQMKSSTWSKDLLEEEDFGESRRKAEIVDLAITISKRNNTKNRIGYLNIAKIRRGIKLNTPYFMDISGKFYEIDEKAFHDLAATPHHYTNVNENAVGSSGIEYRFFDIKDSNSSSSNIETPNPVHSNSDINEDGESVSDFRAVSAGRGDGETLNKGSINGITTPMFTDNNHNDIEARGENPNPKPRNEIAANFDLNDTSKIRTNIKSDSVSLNTNFISVDSKSNKEQSYQAQQTKNEELESAVEPISNTGLLEL